MITYPQIPVLIDNFIVEFNTKIVELLPWLNNPLGRVQPVTKAIDIGGKTQKISFPAMHTDSGEYIEVFPNDKLVNYSWFSIGAYDISERRKAKYYIPAKFNMFINLEKVYPTIVQSRNLENAKAEVINALISISLISGAIRANKVSEDYKEVYAGFAVPLIQDKYFMQPYAGLSFELDMYIKNNVSICV